MEANTHHVDRRLQQLGIDVDGIGQGEHGGVGGYHVPDAIDRDRGSAPRRVPRRVRRRALDDAPEVMVVEDDHLGPVAGAPRLTLTAGRRRWAAARSLAKSLGPDFRLAVLAGDAQTIGRVGGRQAVGPGWVSMLLQRMGAMLWADDAGARRLEGVAATYGERRERFVAALAERGIHVEAPAGINVWIPVPNETHVVQALHEQGWAVTAGAPFRLKSEPAIRVTISTLQADEALALAAAIADALQPSQRTRAA
jgi:DNA-binding transcriptional MocR family regulator